MSNEQPQKSLMEALVLTTDDFIYKNGKYWMESTKLGELIGYQNPGASISQLYERNKRELEPYTCTMKIIVQGQRRLVRVFQDHGCHILAMFAKTEQALIFRIAISNFLVEIRSENQRKKFESILRNTAHLDIAKCRQIFMVSEYMKAKDIAQIYNISPAKVKHIVELYPVLHQEFLNDKNIWSAVDGDDLVSSSDIKKLLWAIASEQEEEPEKVTVSTLKAAAKMALGGETPEKIARENRIPQQAISDFISLRTHGYVARS